MKAADRLWARISVLLAALENRIYFHNPEYILTLNHYQNETFPLRAYLSIVKNPSGDELALMVDAQIIGEKLDIMSGLYRDNGQMLLEGPYLSLVDSAMSCSSEVELDEWLSRFDVWILDSEMRILLECDALS